MTYLWLSFNDTLCRFPPPEHVEAALFWPGFCPQRQVTSLSNKSYFSALHVYMDVTNYTYTWRPVHSGRKFEFQYDNTSWTFSNIRRALISDTDTGGIAFFSLFPSFMLFVVEFRANKIYAEPIICFIFKTQFDVCDNIICMPRKLDASGAIDITVDWCQWHLQLMYWLFEFCLPYSLVPCLHPCGTDIHWICLSSVHEIYTK